MHRKLTRAAAAALTIVGLAACGTSGGSGAASTAPHSSTSAASSTTAGTSSSSAPATTAASSSSAPSDLGFTKPAPGGSVDAAAFGHAVTKAIEAEKSYHLVMTSPSEKTAIEGDVRHDSSSRTDMSLMSPEGGIRIVDNSVYLADPSGEMAGGKKWMVISKDSKSPFASMMFSAINSMLSSAGLQGAGMADSVYASAKARFVGDESAGAHYTVVVGADKLLESSLSMAEEMASGAGMPPAIVDQMKVEIDKQKAKVAGKTVGYDYWLDDRMRPVKTKIDATALGGAGSDNSLTLSDRMTVAYSKWGESVTITAPPASETISVDKALGDAMGSAMPTDLPSALATDLPSSAK